MMSSSVKHASSNSGNAPPSKKFKTEMEDIDSEYKIENYITEQEINDIISRRRVGLSPDIQRKTCCFFDLPVNIVSRNIIVNPESGEVESVMQKECDKSMTPQSFYISSPSLALDIIEEEAVPNDLESVVSKNNTSTRTELNENRIGTHFDDAYTFRSSNLNVKYSSDSMSDWSDCSVNSSKVSGFHQKYRETISKIDSKTKKSIATLGILKSRSVPILSEGEYLNHRNMWTYEKNRGKHFTDYKRNNQLSSSRIGTNQTTSLSSCNTNLSENVNRGSHTFLTSTGELAEPPASFRNYREKIRKMKELCGLPTHKFYEKFDSAKRNRMCFTDTSSTDWSTSSISSSKSSNVSKLYQSLDFANSNQSDQSSVSTERKRSKWNSYAPEPPRRTTRILYRNSNCSDGFSSCSNTTSESEIPQRKEFALRKNVPPINRCSTTSTSSYCSNVSGETFRSIIASSVIEEVTNSLNELSRKIDTYIQKNEKCFSAISKSSNSDTSTDSTIRCIQDQSVISDYYESDYAYIKRNESVSKVPTLKKLALKVVLSFENGIDLLSDIYFVPPQKSTHLNKIYTKIADCCQYRHEHIPRCIPRTLQNTCPQVQLVRYPKSGSKSIGSAVTIDYGTLFDNHQKFIRRRSYFENCKTELNSRTNFVFDDTRSPKTPKSCVFNVDKNYTKELLEEAANLLAVRKYREMRSREFKKGRHREMAKTQIGNSFSEQYDSLESVQNTKQFRTDLIDQIENNVNTSQLPDIKINSRLTPTCNVVNAVRSTALVTTKCGGSVRPKFQSAIYNHDIRQKMYAEYMEKVAERFQRRQKKVIRITKRPLSEPTMVKIFQNDERQEKPNSLEEEFMQKARMRMHKFGISLEEQTTEGYGKIEVKKEELPNHLREFIQIIGDNDEGVWSPGQTRKLERRSSDVGKPQKEVKNSSGSSTPVIWSPRSAPSSPTNERKTYKPVIFDSPVLSKKNIASKSQESLGSTAELKFSDSNLKRIKTNLIVAPKTKCELSENSTYSNGREHLGYTLKTEKNEALITTIANNANLINTTASKLPRVQNPTITLLQKAREGQLPKGAFYLDHTMNEKEFRETNKRIQPNEIVYSMQNDYESENENSKRQKKMAQQSDGKPDGIGPTTKDGVSTVLRSELRDENHAKWYKQMYDSLHKSYDDQKGFTQNGGGYQSEPEHFSGYNSDFDASRYTIPDNKYSSKNKENQYTYGTMPRPSLGAVRQAGNMYKNHPGRIEDYEPGHSSAAQKEIKENLNEGNSFAYNSKKTFSSLRGSGYESDSTLVFKRREDNQQPISPAEQRSLYKSIQKGGEVPFHGLRKPAPEKPKESVIRTHDLFHPLSNTGVPTNEHHFTNCESPHKYAESEVTLQYKIPVRNEIKATWSEEELNRRQAETMRRIYQEERRRKYLQELQDMSNRRHTDNFTPSQKSPIPLNRYDDVLEESIPQRSRSRTPEPKLVARALYNFTGQTSRELTFRKGDIIFVKRQIDKNWYEGEHNAMIGLFPINYVEIIPYDEIRTLPKRPSEGQARAKFNFVAQTNLELSLVKGELIILTRRVDDNWYEGRVGNRRGIFPVSYVNVIREPGEYTGLPDTMDTTLGNYGKPVASPAAHSLITNQYVLPSQHSYQPNSYATPVTLPRTTNRVSQRNSNILPFNETLHVDTTSEPIPYRALYNYKPQNEDELELREGDTVFVMEKCDDGWYVGSSQRTLYFGTFPGNYVERIS